MSRPLLSLVAIVARDGGVGRDNDLLIRIPEDQKHFRRVTMGHPVVMGRRTWDSLPPHFRPLPGRRNIVLSRDTTWTAEGAERAGSLDEALALTAGEPKVCVIGGAQIYAEALPHADELLMTELDATFPADVFFPDFDRSAWDEDEVDPRVHDDGMRYRFVRYRRRAGA